MSATTSTTVACDTCRRAIRRTARVTRLVVDIDDLRALLTLNGWTFDGNEDRCNKCNNRYVVREVEVRCTYKDDYSGNCATVLKLGALSQRAGEDAATANHGWTRKHGEHMLCAACSKRRITKAMAINEMRD